MQGYIALVHKDAESAYGVSFPDLPGCISAGQTLEEARVLASEALSLHLEGLREDGVLPPQPSTLEEILRHEGGRHDAAFIVVRPQPVSPEMVD